MGSPLATLHLDDSSTEPTPMIIEIRGVQPFNLGAQLMLDCIRQRLADALPHARIALALNRLSPRQWIRSQDALCKLPLRKGRVDLSGLHDHLPEATARLLLKAGFTLDSNIQATLDASGFAYGQAWGDYPLIAVTQLLRRHAERGAPYLFLPQSFGPFEITSKIAQQFGAELNQSAAVFARDTASLDALKTLSVNHPWRACPDLTLDRHAFARISRLRERPMFSARSGAYLCLVPNTRMWDQGPYRADWQANYLDWLEAAARAGERLGLRALVLNHGGAEDHLLCKRLAERLKGAELHEPHCPWEARAQLAGASLVISSRYHACLGALAHGVPTIATAWSGKYRSMLEDFGHPDWVFDRPDQNAVSEWMERTLYEQAGLSALLRQRALSLASEVDAMWSVVIEKLGTRS